MIMCLEFKKLGTLSRFLVKSLDKSYEDHFTTTKSKIYVNEIYIDRISP